MIGLFATTCPFPISGISPSETGEFCFRFRVLLFYATHLRTGSIICTVIRTLRKGLSLSSQTAGSLSWLSSCIFFHSLRIIKGRCKPISQTGLCPYTLSSVPFRYRSFRSPNRFIVRIPFLSPSCSLLIRMRILPIHSWSNHFLSRKNLLKGYNPYYPTNCMSGGLNRSPDKMHLDSRGGPLCKAFCCSKVVQYPCVR